MFLTPWHCDVATGRNYLERAVADAVTLQFFLCPPLCTLSLPKLCYCSAGGYHGGGRVLERSCCDEGNQAPQSGAVIRLVSYFHLSVLIQVSAKM